jgi:hypothetical protein
MRCSVLGARAGLEGERVGAEEIEHRKAIRLDGVDQVEIGPQPIRQPPRREHRPVDARNEDREPIVARERGVDLDELRIEDGTHVAVQMGHVDTRL